MRSDFKERWDYTKNIFFGLRPKRTFKDTKEQRKKQTTTQTDTHTDAQTHTRKERVRVRAPHFTNFFVDV